MNHNPMGVAAGRHRQYTTLGVIQSSDDYAKLFTGKLTGDTWAFCTGAELNPWAVIDLGKECNVKGVMIRNRPGFNTRKTGMKLSLSTDGEKWEKAWFAKTHPDTWEISVTSYVAGAYLPGKKARYLKIERTLTSADSLHLQAVKVYGE